MNQQGKDHSVENNVAKRLESLVSEIVVEIFFSFEDHWITVENLHTDWKNLFSKKQLPHCARQIQLILPPEVSWEILMKVIFKLI